MDQTVRTSLVQKLVNHTSEFADWFNEAAALEGLKVSLDPSLVINHYNAAKGDTFLYEASWALENERMDRKQVQTGVRAVARMLETPARSGIVLDTTQAGGAGMAMMLLFGPALQYLRADVKYVPLFITRNIYAHDKKMRSALRGFVVLYASLDIISEGGPRETGSAVFEEYSLASYYYEMLELDDRKYTRALGESYLDLVIDRRPNGGMSHLIEKHRRHEQQRGQELMVVLAPMEQGPENGAKVSHNRMPSLLSNALTELDADFFSSSQPCFMVGTTLVESRLPIAKDLWLAK